MKILPRRNSTLRSALRGSFLLTAVALACFALSPTGQAAGGLHPPPDGGYAGGNTAEGDNALFSLTTGVNNTAMGFQALFSNTTGSQSTAVGSQALYNSQTTSTPDTYGSTVGQGTAVGYQALFNNTTGNQNVAVGSQALLNNTVGILNVAIGDVALSSNISGLKNIAIGASTLGGLTTGDSNTAVGGAALAFSETVNFNTAIGRRALFRTQADQNIGLGFFAGSNLRDGGTNNIYVGNVGPDPIGTESNTIRLGTQTATTATIGNPPIESHPMPAHTATFIAGIRGTSVSNSLFVVIDPDGQLGTSDTPPSGET